MILKRVLGDNLEFLTEWKFKILGAFSKRVYLYQFHHKVGVGEINYC